jgi:hypothetical protein
MTLSTPTGAGLAQGGYHHFEKRFSPEQFFLKRGFNKSKILMDLLLLLVLINQSEVAEFSYRIFSSSWF